MERIKRIPIWVILAIGIVLLLPAVFMGMDVCDSGFYLVFYDNLFDAPESVEYNFMYYISGITGAVWSRIWPDGGIIWMRIGGVCGVLGSVWMVVDSYRDVVTRPVAALAVLSVVAAYTQLPLTLSYDIVSLVLISGALTLLLRDSDEKGGLRVAAAGILAGVALFARIPNVLFFSLIILIWLKPGITHKDRVKLSFMFAGGYAAAIAGVILYMICAGHLEVFISNMRTLAGVSADGEASHGFTALIMAQVRYYLMVGRVAVKIGAVAAWCMMIGRVRLTWVRRLLYLPAAIYLCHIIIVTPPTQVLGAAVIPVLIVMSVARKHKSPNNIARAALLVAIVFPCGSDGGGNMGSILYLWGAPAALLGWLKLRFKVSGIKYSLPPALTYGGVAAFVCITLWQTCTGGLYFDSTPVMRMGATIDHLRARGVFTSQPRAEVINNLLPHLEEYVAPGDTLFAYGSIPLINYLTSTRPFIGCSWPELLSASALEERLSSTTVRPVMCVQRFATIGSKWGKPSEEFVSGSEEASANVFHTPAKWAVVRNFLEQNGYRKAEGTAEFDIYIPTIKDKT